MGGKYPAIVKLWENAWEEFAPFLRFDMARPVRWADRCDEGCDCSK
jgi:transposase-like protein